METHHIAIMGWGLIVGFFIGVIAVGLCIIKNDKEDMEVINRYINMGKRTDIDTKI
jgi:hypothetical protein